MLVTSGWGTIILGIWPVLQMVMFIFLMPEDFNASIQEYEFSNIARTGYIIFALLFLAIDLLFRVLAGRAAIQEGKGRKISSRCIVFGIILLILSVYSVIRYFQSPNLEFLSMSTWVDLIIQAFLLFVNIQLLVSAIIVKAERKKIAGINAEQ